MYLPQVKNSNQILKQATQTKNSRFLYMLLRKTSKYAVVIISVLIASLLNEYIIKHLNEYYKDKTYLSILITMLVTVFVFVPMYGITSKLTQRFSKAYLKRSKGISKNSWIGLILGFLIAFVILFVFYGFVRHNVDVLKALGIDL